MMMVFAMDDIIFSLDYTMIVYNYLPPSYESTKQSYVLKPCVVSSYDRFYKKTEK